MSCSEFNPVHIVLSLVLIFNIWPWVTQTSFNYLQYWHVLNFISACCSIPGLFTVSWLVSLTWFECMRTETQSPETSQVGNTDAETMLCRFSCCVPVYFHMCSIVLSSRDRFGRMGLCRIVCSYCNKDMQQFSSHCTLPWHVVSKKKVHKNGNIVTSFRMKRSV